jgi:hypothetical protein
VQPSDLAAEVDKQMQEGFENQKLNPEDSLIVVGFDNLHLNITGLDSMEESGTLLHIEKLKELLDSGLRVDQAVDSIALDNSAFEAKLYTQIGKMYVSDSATLSKYFFSNFSIIILVMQPFFALLLKLLYIRRKKPFRFIQHLVFSLYYHGWMLIIATIGILIEQMFDGFNTLAFVALLALMYLPMAIKKFYGQGWTKSLLKTLLILLLYAGLIVPFFIVISVLLSFYFF